MKERFAKITVILTHLARAMISGATILVVSSTHLLHVKLILIKVKADTPENSSLTTLTQTRGRDAIRKSTKVSLIQFLDLQKCNAMIYFVTFRLFFALI